ncbi:hypothetical protein VPH35_058685 [Triticum aestivum]|uniref:UDP-glycosyltransferase 73C5-like n=1 Tax=Triticum aestivum TaxID=4565 RepID=UPI001D02AFAE|nr:UDP-glycosyltransferase 73C5-like [Triticum aestivum]
MTDVSACAAVIGLWYIQGATSAATANAGHDPRPQWRWSGDIARELSIPRLAFIGFCGFSSLVRHITFQTNVFDHVKDENELITITGFPTSLELTKTKSPGGLSIPGADQIHGMILEEVLRCDGEVIKSFQELEALYIESFEQMTGKKARTSGPMCLCHRNNNTVAARGIKTSTDEAH